MTKLDELKKLLTEARDVLEADIPGLAIAELSTVPGTEAQAEIRSLCMARQRIVRKIDAALRRRV